MRVALGQLLLTGGGNQYVTLGLQDVSLIWRRIWETHDGPVSLQTQVTTYLMAPCECLLISTDQVASMFIGLTFLAWSSLMATDQFVVFQLFGVDAFGVPDASVHFSDADALCPVTMKVAHGVKTHVTETLRGRKDETLARVNISESIISI